MRYRDMMYRQPVLLALLVGASLLCVGQGSPNLIPNPGFEQHFGLPDGEGNVFKLKGWFNPSGGTELPYATPDFLHIQGENQVRLPDSYYGTVYPYDSNAVAGFSAYVGWKKNFREYLATPLLTPLEPGSTYRLSLQITNGQSRQYTGGGVKDLGILFSAEKPVQEYSWPLLLKPQIQWEKIVFNTNWEKLEGTFTATDPFKYICIGNFMQDSVKLYQHFLPEVATGAYYFVDAVRLEKLNLPVLVQPKDPRQLPKKLGDRRVTRPQRLTVASDTVKLLVYDPRAEDGDSISLAWNGQWLLHAHKVMNKPLELTVILTPGGNNTLLFYAHNLGSVPPNTAVVAYDTPDGKRQEVEVVNDLKQSGAVTLTRKR